MKYIALSQPNDTIANQVITHLNSGMWKPSHDKEEFYYMGVRVKRVTTQPKDNE